MPGSAGHQGTIQPKVHSKSAAYLQMHTRNTHFPKNEVVAERCCPRSPGLGRGATRFCASLREAAGSILKKRALKTITASAGDKALTKERPARISVERLKGAH
ncbi:hypothetical protein NDU88_004861 [Pleurodeles waltl]|uniref:Uncharacterized protein n=1 Tax=Pleurodeles waltl TaxID=8319 RepID=A0AAV7PHY0_PLEWA|nr:hypothetical protein NDU88_004861 [Pleurodeles waltl]